MSEVGGVSSGRGRRKGVRGMGEGGGGKGGDSGGDGKNKEN